MTLDHDHQTQPLYGGYLGEVTKGWGSNLTKSPHLSPPALPYHASTHPKNKIYILHKLSYFIHFL